MESEGCLDQRGQWLVGETDKVTVIDKEQGLGKKRRDWAGKDSPVVPSHRSKNNA